jgi:hypothetical protein
MASTFNGGGVRAGGIPTRDTGHPMAEPSAEEMRRLLNFLGLSAKSKRQFRGISHGVHTSHVNPVPSNLQILAKEYLRKPGALVVRKCG